MSATKSVLPEAVRKLPLSKKIERLRALHPTDADAIQMIVNDCLEHRWREHFHAGVRGGLALKKGSTS